MRSIRNVPRLELIAASLSVSIGVLLLATKFVAYALTGSAAIFSDALESIVNVLASLFAFYSLFLAHQPPDKEHPYGHGKIEFLSAGFEGGMILLASLVIAAKAIGTLYEGPRLERIDTGIYLMAAAMAVNGAVGGYLIRIGKHRGAIVLEADGYHLLSDAITSIAVIAALLIVHFSGWAYLDPITALLVAGYLVRVAWGLLRRAASGLMDEQDIEDEKAMIALLDVHTRPPSAGGKLPTICSYHKLRHRHSGRYHWIDFHMVVPATWNTVQGHDAASAIEHEIEQLIAEGDATAHVEPCTEATCPHCHPT